MKNTIKYKCLYCKKVFYAYKNSTRKFCSDECSNMSKRRRTQQICLQCNKKFEVSNSRIKYGIGKYCSKKCLSKSMKGKKLTITSQNEGKTYEEIFGKEQAEIYKKKISEGEKGRGFTKKQRKAFSEFWGLSGNKAPNWQGGLPKCIDCEKQISHGATRCERCRIKFQVGENHPKWKENVSSLSDSIKHLSEYTKWRHQIHVRDNFTCVECGQVGGKLHVHHIKSFAQILEENNIKDVIQAQLCNELWDTNNGVVLCYECHKLTDSYLCGRGKTEAKKDRNAA